MRRGANEHRRRVTDENKIAMRRVHGRIAPAQNGRIGCVAAFFF
jgi:hypothetical protein